MRARERPFVLGAQLELLAGAASQGGRVVSRKLKSFDEGDLRRQGFHEFLFIVRASNIGRIAIDITHWDIFTSKGLDYSLEDFHLNPTLPYHLKPGSVVNFYIPMEHIVAAVYAASVLRGLAKTVCASVTLRTGAERRSKMHRIPTVNL